ncbi:hypothetical protein [Saccharopolyspora pogona]|uniref:hypothetical protein n=1 Tax=Saccharopolyspora pogona TaxID=333966 RepID=UPI001CC253C7|nr:hypothetical protein [Saccharopolyspora pogona]
MLSTGARIGEVLAFTGGEFDADGPTIAVDYHIIRGQGVGLVRRKLRKETKADYFSAYRIRRCPC